MNTQRKYPPVKPPEPFKPHGGEPGYDGQLGPTNIRPRDLDGEGKREVETKEWRIDRLQYLFNKKVIGQHHFDAGQRLQKDWQTSKIESRAVPGGIRGSGSARSTLTDAACDATDRVNAAMAVVPTELVTLLTLFLMPHDHPQSLERCAAAVRMNAKAATLGLRVGLSLLARHYGYST